MRFLNETYMRTSRKGFTAMEIAMVGAILALFALLIMPQFKEQVEKARVTAAKADLESLMKAEVLAKAETGYYLRLEDLDNVKDNWPATITNGVTNEVPFFRYSVNVDPTSATNRPVMTLQQRQAFAKQFGGPYCTMPKTITYTDLKDTTKYPVSQYLLRSISGLGLAPVQDFPTATNGNDFDSLQNRYPVDPWGNPYLFYPVTGNTGSDTTSFFDCLIVSLGPDGLPGVLTGNTAADYQRSKTVGWGGIGTTLANSDDITLSF